MSLLFLVLVLLPLAARGERFSCRGRILGGYYADAKSGCKAFHVCVRVAGGGIRDFRFFCPPGTLFHQEAQTCTDWGDDDPLACPADLYDGQFDLYRIGSGFDTKKVTSNNQREEESEFGLQRAETGDRRLHQNTQKTASAAASASDLKTSHSSDFFTGSRDRGRDDGAQQTHHRTSFRRPTTQFSTHSTPSTYSTFAPSSQAPQEYFSKRKLIRKRPVSQIPLSTPIPTTTQSFSPIANNVYTNKNAETNQNFPSDQNYPNNQVRKSNIDSTNNQDLKRNLQYSGNQNNDQKYQRIPNNNFQKNQDNQNGLNRQSFENDIQYNQGAQNYQGNQIIQNQPINQFPNAQYFQKKDVNQKQKQSHSPRSKQIFDQEQERRKIIETEKSSTLPPYVDKDEYVEVSRITPKPHKLVNQNSEIPNNPTKERYSKKVALTELYNINSQSTPSINNNQNKEQKEIYNKVTLRNYYNVAPLDEQNIDVQKNNIVVNSNGARSPSSTLGLDSAIHSSTPSYQSRESSRVSYEPEKNTKSSKSYQEHSSDVNRGRSFPSTQVYSQNFITSPAPSGRFSHTANSVEPLNLNNVAHKTNVGFNAKQVNYDEDDGQYRLPPNEDDGQYRPELYERELLSGAHSLNIAASGNRLPEDQKPRNKPIIGQTAVPRPFSVSPDTKVTQPQQQTKIQSFSTTFRPQPTTQTQRTFDYYQTYTTTSRPETSPNHFIQTTEENLRQTSAKFNPTNPSTFKQQQSQVKTSQVKKTVLETKPPAYSKPASTSEDNSYDYAYYDSDPGFSEYEPVEEFSKTKTL